jgi:5-methylcytosine-specific restriction protein A
MSPTASPHACAQSGCPALVPRGQSRCQAHRRRRWREYQRRRPDRRVVKQIYHTARWQKVRRLILSREPLCRPCKAAGLVVAAVQVDHIKPVDAGGAPFDSENLQPLCFSCHSRKTLEENRRRGKL